VDDVVPVVSMQLTGVTIAGLAHAFECYVALLQKALPQVEQEEGAVDVDGDTGLVSLASGSGVVTLQLLDLRVSA
jgi:hypothetical protein